MMAAFTSSPTGVLSTKRMWCILWVVAAFSVLCSNGINFRGPPTNSYARFPPWNACTNASISFEFKTTQEEGLLMYVDDGGRYDFMEVMQRSGTVVLQLNIVDGREGKVEIRIGNNVNDGRWHRVEILRNRMETTLLVDGTPSSRYSFGSDFYFGRPTERQPVYFGGLPPELEQSLHTLALPSSLFETRFMGDIRNVLYSNCSCQSVRAALVHSEGVNVYPREACDVRNPCLNQPGCVCISDDNEPKCDCSQIECVAGKSCLKAEIPQYTSYMCLVII